MAAKKQDPYKVPGLSALLEAIDRSVRSAGVRAHEHVITEIARVEGKKIGDVEIPADALIPRDILEAKRTAMEFEVLLTKDGVAFSKGLMKCGSTIKVSMEWEAVPAPEATSLVRTKAEAVLASDIKHG